MPDTEEKEIQDNVTEDIQNDIQPEASAEASAESESPKEYISRKDHYRNMKDTADTLIVIGALGAGLIVCNMIFKFKFLTKSITVNIIALCIFAAILIIGIITFIKSRSVKEQAITEEDSTDKIISNFINDNSAESIDSQIDLNQSDELLYFERVNVINSILRNTYRDADEAYLESVADKIFEKIYG